MPVTYQTYTTPPPYVAPVWIDRKAGSVSNRDELKWANDAPPPPVGTDIEINFNNLGRATVTGYFMEGNWLGLLVRIHKPPPWHQKQNPGNSTGHIFGPEFTLAPTGESTDA